MAVGDDIRNRSSIQQIKLGSQNRDRWYCDKQVTFRAIRLIEADKLFKTTKIGLEPVKSGADNFYQPQFHYVYGQSSA